MSDPGKAVFLSYASQDAAAAKTICEALRAAGVEVWFDQSELVGGDAWDQKIRRNIKECELLIPIISQNTQARSEGYFRLEWRLADQRTHLMAKGRPYLLPVVIDDTRDSDAHVPDSFTEVQWTKLPGGETPPAFVARVQKLLAGGSAFGPGAARPAAVSEGRWQWWMLFPIVGTIMGLLFAAAPLLKALRGRPAKPAPPPVVAPAAPAVAGDNSVAVLAFTNLSDEKDNEYFSDGISEELLNVLAKVPNLKVSARTSAFSFKGREVPVTEIARQLGVAYVVEGSVRRSGDKVRITAQLIKASDGFQVWSDSFARDLKDIFAVQDEIARLIAQNLSLKLGVTGSGVAHPVDPEAYRLLTLGRALVYRASAGDVEQGVTNLQAAVVRDPKLALAWAWLGIAQWAQSVNGWSPIKSGIQESRAAAERALALDPDLPEAHMAIGLVYYGYDWDWARARAAFQRAQQFAPGNASLIANLCRVATTLGQNDEAVWLGRRAVELDPLNSYAQYGLGMALFQAGRYEEMAEFLKDFSVTGLSTYKLQIFARVLQGKSEEALLITEKVDATSFNRPFLTALTQWACGRAAEADAALAELKAMASERAAYQIAQLYAQRGATDDAFAWLEKSYTLHDSGMIWLKNDPLLKSLHTDPRWPVLLGKMNLADEQRK